MHRCTHLPHGVLNHIPYQSFRYVHLYIIRLDPLSQCAQSCFIDQLLTGQQHNPGQPVVVLLGAPYAQGIAQHLQAS